MPDNNVFYNLKRSKTADTGMSIAGISGIQAFSKEWRNADNVHDKSLKIKSTIIKDSSKTVKTSSALVGGDAHRKKNIQKYFKNKLKVKRSTQKMLHDVSAKDSEDGKLSNRNK